MGRKKRRVAFLDAGRNSVNAKKKKQHFDVTSITSQDSGFDDATSDIVSNTADNEPGKQTGIVNSAEPTTQIANKADFANTIAIGQLTADAVDSDVVAVLNKVRKMVLDEEQQRKLALEKPVFQLYPEDDDSTGEELSEEQQKLRTEFEQGFTEEQLNRRVFCKTADGIYVEVRWILMLQCRVFLQMWKLLNLEAWETPPTFEDEPFPLNDITYYIFQFIVQWLEHHHGLPDPVIKTNPYTFDRVRIEKDKFEEDFLHIGDNLLVDIYQSSNYLDIPSLYYYCAQECAERVMEKSMFSDGEERIRKFLRLADDVSDLERIHYLDLRDRLTYLKHVNNGGSFRNLPTNIGDKPSTSGLRGQSFYPRGHVVPSPTPPPPQAPGVSAGQSAVGKEEIANGKRAQSQNGCLKKQQPQRKGSMDGIQLLPSTTETKSRAVKRNAENSRLDLAPQHGIDSLKQKNAKATNKGRKRQRASSDHRSNRRRSPKRRRSTSAERQ